MNLKLKRCEYWMAAQKQMKRVVPLLLVIMPACSIAGMRFNPAFLSGDTEAVADLSRFERDDLSSGSYEVEVWVNDSPLLSRTVTFKADDANQLIPCFSLADLLSLGINKMRCQSRLWLHLKIVALICVSGFLMCITCRSWMHRDLN